MKNKLVCIMICSAMTVTLFTGCSKNSAESNSGSGSVASTMDSTSSGKVYDTEDLLNAMGYDPDDYVTLGDYESINVTIKKADYELTDDYLEEQISYYLEDYPEYTEEDKTEVEDGDMVNIDYTGTIDGEEFDGGTDEGYILEIGSGEFVDGFESGLIGKKVGDEVTLDLTFPDDYYDDSVAGKDVTFKVKINAIVTSNILAIDELTDDFVKENMSEDLEVSTVDEFKDYVKEMAESDLEDQKDMDIQDKAMTKLKKISTIEVSDDEVQAQIDYEKEQIEAEAEAEEMDLDEYVSEYYGYDSWDDVEEYLNEELPDEMETTFLNDALIKELGYSVSADDLEMQYSFMMQLYGYDDYDEFCEANGGEEGLALSYAEECIPESLIEHITVTEK